MSLNRFWQFALCVLLFGACGEIDKSVGTTSENDFTLTLQVVDRFVHVGDQVPILVRLKRTDNSNLQKGMQGTILITTSNQGRVDVSNIPITVPDEQTIEFVEHLVFTAQTPGVAEVRATFLDATILIKVLISSVSV